MKNKGLLILPVAALSLIGGGVVSANAAKTHSKGIVWNKKMAKHAVHYKNSKSVMWNTPVTSAKNAKKVHNLKNYKNTTFTTLRHAKTVSGNIFYYVKSGKVAGWVNKKYIKLGTTTKVQAASYSMPYSEQKDDNNTVVVTPSAPTTTTTVTPSTSSSTSTVTPTPSNNASSTTNNSSQETPKTEAEKIAEVKDQAFADFNAFANANLKPSDPQMIDMMNKQAAAIESEFGETGKQAYMEAFDLANILSKSDAEMKVLVTEAYKNESEDIRNSTSPISDEDLQIAAKNGISDEKIQTLAALLTTPDTAENTGLVSIVNDNFNPETTNAKDVEYIENHLNSYSQSAYERGTTLGIILKTIQLNDIEGATNIINQLKSANDNPDNKFQEFLKRIYKRSIIIKSSHKTLSSNSMNYLVNNQ